MALDTLSFWYSKLQSPYMQLLSWIPKNTFVFIFHPFIVTISNPKCSAYPLGRRCYKLPQNKAGCKFWSNCMCSVWKRLLSLYQDCYYLGILLLLNKGVLGHSFLSVKQQQSPARCPISFCVRSQYHPKGTDKMGEGNTTLFHRYLRYFLPPNPNSISFMEMQGTCITELAQDLYS